MYTTEAPALLHDRAEDLAAVGAATAPVLAGGRRLVAVTGTPGAGRSAFLDSAAELADGQGLVVLRAAAGRLEHGVASGVARQVLASAIGADDGEPLWSPPRTPCGAALDGCVPGAVLGDALSASGRAPAHTAVAILVDDLQWADEASLDWLARLFADTATGPAGLLVLVTVCDGEAEAELPAVQDMLNAADRVIRLGPLTADGARAFLGQRSVLLSDEGSRAWARAAGGNPALLDSLCQRLAGIRRPAHPHLLAAALARPAPWSLRGRVAAALSGHPEPVRRYAYCAALLGGPAEGQLIARLARLDPAEQAAAERALRRLGWSADGYGPEVLWECVREIAEDSYSLAACDDLHRRAATFLHASGHPAEEVAGHLLEVGPGVHAHAARILHEAADDARGRGDHYRAIRYLRRALREFPLDSPRRGGYLAALADAEQDFDTSAMLRHLAQAAPLLGSARERAAVAACVPLTLSAAASPAAHEAIECARAALVGSGTPDPGTADLAARLEARARLAGLGSPTASADAVARLRELGPQADLGTSAGRELVAVLTFGGTVGGQLPAGEVATLVGRMLDREPASSASGYAATSLMIASGTAAGAGEPVRSWLDMALETARGRGDERQRTRMLCWRAMAAQHTGLLADAWSDARDACGPGSVVLGTNDWLSVLGLMSVAVDTRDPWLIGEVQAACADQRDAGMPVLHVGLLALRAQTAPMSELPGLVAELVDGARRAAAAGWHNPSLFPMAYWAAPALLRLGETETARELIAEECDRARMWGASATLGRALRVWGTLVPGRYALSLLAESVAVLRESSNTLELGRALMAYGTRLRAAGRPGFRDLFTEADGIADTVGTSLLKCWAEPGQGESRGVGLLGTDWLSVTERRVAGLVSLGRTNQGVADELDVTRRAVEKCLTRLYRRLGVSSRAELIPVVRRIAGATAYGWGVRPEDLYRAQ